MGLLDDVKNKEKCEEIINRYNAVIAEKNLQEKNGVHYNKLSEISKLILGELKGSDYRHIMFCTLGGYDYYLSRND